MNRHVLRSDLREQLRSLRASCDAEVLFHFALMDRRILDSLSLVVDIDESGRGIGSRLEAALRRGSAPSDLAFTTNSNEVLPPSYLVFGKMLEAVGKSPISFRERAALTSKLNSWIGDVGLARGEVVEPQPVISLCVVVGARRAPSNQEMHAVASASAKTFFAERRSMTLRSERFHQELIQALSQISAERERLHIDPNGSTLIEAYCIAAARCLDAAYVLVRDAHTGSSRVEVEQSAPESDARVHERDFVRRALQQGIVTLQRDPLVAHMAVPIRSYIVGRRRAQERVLILSRAGPALREYDVFDEVLAAQACARIARTFERARRHSSMRKQLQVQQVGALAASTISTTSTASERLPTEELHRLGHATASLVGDIRDITGASSASLRILAPSRSKPDKLGLWQVAASQDSVQSPICHDPDSGTNWATITSGEPVYIADWEASKLPTVFRGNTRSSLTVPVYDSTSLIGTLNLESTRQADFLEHVTDAVDYATLAGRAHDLVRMTAWTQFVRATAMESGELHVLANELWNYRKQTEAVLPELAPMDRLEDVELSMRNLLKAGDISESRPRDLALRSLLPTDSEWTVRNSETLDRRILPAMGAVLSLVVAELLRNAKDHAPYGGKKQIAVSTEVFNGVDWVILNIVNQPRVAMTETAVAEMFRSVDLGADDDRVRVGTVQCGWLASLIGGRLDAWRLPAGEISVQLRLPPECFAPRPPDPPVASA